MHESIDWKITSQLFTEADLAGFLKICYGGAGWDLKLYCLQERKKTKARVKIPTCLHKRTQDEILTDV